MDDCDFEAGMPVGHFWLRLGVRFGSDPLCRGDWSEVDVEVPRVECVLRSNALWHVYECNKILVSECDGELCSQHIYYRYLQIAA